jgi:hypothetical protein
VLRSELLCLPAGRRLWHGQEGCSLSQVAASELLAFTATLSPSSCCGFFLVIFVLKLKSHRVVSVVAGRDALGYHVKRCSCFVSWQVVCVCMLLW